MTIENIWNNSGLVAIPAYNEEESIGDTLDELSDFWPKNRTLVVDDGSEDKTADFALNAGADKVVSHKRNMGVGATFMTGIRNAISMNADVVVTVDADSQFDSKQIPELIVPILNHQLDVVIGSRFLGKLPKEMPRIKNIGNKIFSKIVSWLISQKLSDTQTGFRAYSKEALLNVSIVNDFTYTQEVLIDLKFKGLQIGEIPVKVTYDEKRKSRVVKSIFNYTTRALSIIIRTLAFHRPIFAFGIFGAILIGGGVLAKIITIMNIFERGVSPGLSTGFIILGVVSFMMGILASVVFKRQAFAEKDLRHYIEQTNRFKD